MLIIKLGTLDAFYQDRRDKSSRDKSQPSNLVKNLPTAIAFLCILLKQTIRRPRQRDDLPFDTSQGGQMLLDVGGISTAVVESLFTAVDFNLLR